MSVTAVNLIRAFTPCLQEQTRKSTGIHPHSERGFCYHVSAQHVCHRLQLAVQPTATSHRIRPSSKTQIAGKVACHSRFHEGLCLLCLAAHLLRRRSVFVCHRSASLQQHFILLLQKEFLLPLSNQLFYQEGQRNLALSLTSSVRSQSASPNKPPTHPSYHSRQPRRHISPCFLPRGKHS